MRTEEQMMKLILDTAKEDERILAVYMNGSRTNPNAPKDIFQDYDIIYVVTETESFRKTEPGSTGSESGCSCSIRRKDFRDCGQGKLSAFP